MYDTNRGEFGTTSPGEFNKTPINFTQPVITESDQEDTQSESIPYYVDIHCHTTLPPYNRCKKTLWFHRSIPTKKERKKRAKITFLYTQADFVSLAKSNTRVILAALYPIEQGFMKPPALKIVLGLAGLGIDAAGVVKEAAKEAVTLFAIMISSAVPPWRAVFVRRFWHSYFKDLCSEYSRLIKPGEAQIPAKIARENNLPVDWNFKIVTCYQELQAVLEQEPHTIAVIPTIEGGNALGGGSKLWTSFISLDELYDKDTDLWSVDEVESYSILEMDKDEKLLQSQLQLVPKSVRVKMLKEYVLANIREIKKWGPGGKYTPFFITLSHHFWNQLCGHSISMATWVKNVLIFDQRPGMLLDFSELGKLAVKELLSRDNGPRILLDCKHMSLAGKAYYYSLIEGSNFGPGDDPHSPKEWYCRLIQEPVSQKGSPAWIPIIASHAGLSARPWMTPTEVITDHRMADHYYKHPDPDKYEHSMFNPWEINLSDEEVIRIFESDGIIGINMDQRILSGKRLNDEITKKSKELWDNRDEYSDLWAKAIVQQLLRAGRVLLNHLKLVKLMRNGVDIDPKDYILADKDALQKEIADATISWDEQKPIWQLFAIGSDFDGMINPLDAFATAQDFGNLRASLTRIFNIMAEKNDADIQKDPILRGDPILKGLIPEQIEEIVNGFLSDNAMRFLEKYYTNEYRL
jgi:hypothetical protein